MSIGIVIITHKEAGKALLESTEMICGKQENVKAISFYETEDIDSLIIKCEKEVSLLDTTEGVLYFVDLFGGSPFHTAYNLSLSKKHHHVVTGVNLPMLMETFLTRENCTVDELYKTAICAGNAGIKTIEDTCIMDSDDE